MRDIGGALEEIKRCLQPGGRLVAATDAPGHMAEYDRLAAKALRSALGREPEADVTGRFDLDSGKPRTLPATLPVAAYDVKIENDEVLIEVSES